MKGGREKGRKGGRRQGRNEALTAMAEEKTTPRMRWACRVDSTPPHFSPKKKQRYSFGKIAKYCRNPQAAGRKNDTRHYQVPRKSVRAAVQLPEDYTPRVSLQVLPSHSGRNLVPQQPWLFAWPMLPCHNLFPSTFPLNSHKGLLTGDF